MRAGLLQDKVATCLYSVANELADDWQAGAQGVWLDQPAVVDGSFITSRYPGDMRPFVRAIISPAERQGRPRPAGKDSRPPHYLPRHRQWP